MQQATISNEDRMTAMSLAYNKWQEYAARSYDSINSEARKNTTNSKFDITSDVGVEHNLDGGGISKPVTINVYKAGTTNVAYAMVAEKVKGILTFEDEIDRLEKEINSLSDRLTNAINNINHEDAQQDAEIAALKAQIANIQSQIDSLNSRVSNDESNTASRIAELQRLLNELNAKLTELSSQSSKFYWIDKTMNYYRTLQLATKYDGKEYILHDFSDYVEGAAYITFQVDSYPAQNSGHVSYHIYNISTPYSENTVGLTFNEIGNDNAVYDYLRNTIMPQLGLKHVRFEGHKINGAYFDEIVSIEQVLSQSSNLSQGLEELESNTLTFTPENKAANNGFEEVDFDSRILTFKPILYYSDMPSWNGGITDMGLVKATGEIQISYAEHSGIQVNYNSQHGTIPLGRIPSSDIDKTVMISGGYQSETTANVSSEKKRLIEATQSYIREHLDAFKAKAFNAVPEASNATEFIIISPDDIPMGLSHGGSQGGGH